jgi:hypothetical protein
MDLVLGISVAVLVLLLVAAVLWGGVAHGRSQADRRWIRDAKRREYRQHRQHALLLARLSEKAGLGPLAPRNEPSGPEGPRKNARTVVPVSQSVSRAIKKDQQFAADHPGADLKAPKQVPAPGVSGRFLADVDAALQNGNGRNNHVHNT